jgi:uncharacterized protein (TIGR03663 family)
MKPPSLRPVSDFAFEQPRQRVSELRRRLPLTLGILVLAVVALAIRLPGLDHRPMHGDEANQAVKAGVLFETGHYRYDPEEHHGPTLYWFTLPSLWLSGASQFAETRERDYRIVPVVFGAALILLLFLLADGLSAGPLLAAALLTAISPAMVYYSRYYIQETLLVFFTVATIGCLWRWFRGQSLAWAVAAGTSVGLMHSTKETWILAAAAMGVGLVATVLWTRWRDGTPLTWPPYLRPIPLLAAMVAACLVAIVFYSSFGTDWKGPVDSVLAYKTYLRRGSESGIHAAPWYEYLRWLVAFRPARGFFWSEGLIVGLAVCGGVFALVRRQPGSGGAASGTPSAEAVAAGPSLIFSRFLALYTLVLLGLYSAIPYKTPWCLLSFLHGMVLLAGVGVYAVMAWARFAPLRAILGGLLLLATAHLGWQTYWLNFRLDADQRNPYVYAHTSRDVLNLAAQMERLARAAPRGFGMVIHVVMPENYWPLPWYLRRFDRVGYWQDAAAWASDSAQGPAPEVILLSPEVSPIVDAHLRSAYNQQMMFGLRPGVFVSAYVREDLWRAFLESGAGRP